MHLYHCLPFTDYSDVPEIAGREKIYASVSVAGCFPQSSTPEKPRGWVFPLVETSTWLCEADGSTIHVRAKNTCSSRNVNLLRGRFMLLPFVLLSTSFFAPANTNWLTPLTQF